MESWNSHVHFSLCLSIYQLWPSFCSNISTLGPLKYSKGRISALCLSLCLFESLKLDQKKQMSVCMSVCLPGSTQTCRALKDVLCSLLLAPEYISASLWPTQIFKRKGVRVMFVSDLWVLKIVVRRLHVLLSAFEHIPAPDNNSSARISIIISNSYMFRKAAHDYMSSSGLRVLRMRY